MNQLGLLSDWIDLYNKSPVNEYNLRYIMSNLNLGPMILVRIDDERVEIIDVYGDVPSDDAIISVGVANLLDENIITINNTKYFKIYRQNHEGSTFCILGSAESDDLSQLFDIVLQIISQRNQIQFLDNSLKIMRYDLTMLIPPDGEMKIDLPEGFIEAAVPGVAYSAVNEQLGPTFITAWPEEFADVTNTLMVVNIYSTLNSEHIARVGHISSNLITSVPKEGELLNIVYTIPNEKARGSHEMHCISVLIAQEFLNMSKLLVFHIKSLHYTAVELLRQKVVVENWNFSLEFDDFKSSKLKTEFQPILRNLQLQIANLFALQIGEREVQKFAEGMS